MVADSTYEVDELILPPWLGLVGGVVAASLMLGFWYLWQSFPQFSMPELLAQIGAVFWPESIAPGVNLAGVGIGVHLILGALFGLLYAVCQQQTSMRNLVAVALFYGFMLWLTTLVLVSPWLEPNLKSAVRSWPWLWGCLLYGLSLSAVAIWLMGQRPAQTVVPKD